MLFQQMQELAAEMKFEEAQKIKKKYLLLENYRAKSEVVSNVLHNIDVFSIEEDSDEKSAFVNYLHITNGAINQAFTFEYKKRLNESKEELLSLGIIEMRERYKSLSREIIVPFELDMELKDVVFTIPQRGDKKKLLELSILNVKQYKADRLKQAEKLNPEQRTVRLLKEIQQELHLDRLPMQIECFDNSNIQGFRPRGRVRGLRQGGKPSKKDYRKYNIKTVEGPDDYASMKEVVKRRYQRAIEEKAPPARPSYHRRWKRANERRKRGDRRAWPEHPHRRTCQRWQTSHFRAIVWLPSPDHRIETEHPPLPTADADSR